MLIAQICIEINDNSKVLLLDAIMLKANSAPNSESTFEQSENVAIALASWATECSQARGSVLLNCSLSYLFKETSTTASTLD